MRHESIFTVGALHCVKIIFKVNFSTISVLKFHQKILFFGQNWKTSDLHSVIDFPSSCPFSFACRLKYAEKNGSRPIKGTMIAANNQQSTQVSSSGGIHRILTKIKYISLFLLKPSSAFLFMSSSWIFAGFAKKISIIIKICRALNKKLEFWYGTGFNKLEKWLAMHDGKCFHGNFFWSFKSLLE